MTRGGAFLLKCALQRFTGLRLWPKYSSSKPRSSSAKPQPRFMGKFSPFMAGFLDGEDGADGGANSEESSPRRALGHRRVNSRWYSPWKYAGTIKC